MSDNELMEFLDSLSDEELYELLIEMGMTEEEFNEMLNEGYEEDYYGEDDSWSWWDDDDYDYEEEDEDSAWWWDDDEEDYDYGYEDDDDWGWGDEDEEYYDDYEDEDSYGGQYQGNPNQSFNNIKDETVGNGGHSSGNNGGSNNTYAPTRELGGRVIEEALVYTQIPTYYATGGQDMARGIKRIDCSGLVINCYKNALKGTDYTLPFNDTTAYNLYAEYSTPTNNPEPGDLIFMSYDSYIDHVGIFTEIRGIQSRLRLL